MKRLKMITLARKQKLIITSNVSVAIQLPSSVNMSRKLRETTGYKQRNASGGM